MPDIKEIEVGDDFVADVTDEVEPAVEEENEPPVEVEPPVEEELPVEEEKPVEEEPPVEEKKPKKEKKPKPAKGKGRQEKGKGEEKGFPNGAAWWKENGEKMAKQGHSQRNIVMKAAREAGVPFDKAVMVMRQRGSIESKVLSLFNS